jgi:hypothetical protein
LQLFSLLGHEGPALHQELVELQAAFEGGKSSSLLDMNHVFAEFAADGRADSLVGDPQDHRGSRSDESKIEDTLDGRTTPVKSLAEAYAEGDTPQTRNKEKLKAGSGDDSESISRVELPVPTSTESSMGVVSELKSEGTDVQGVSLGKSDTAAESPAQFRAGELSYETRMELLSNIRDSSTILRSDVILAILERGSSEAANNPRDLAAFSCLHALLAYINKHKHSVELQTFRVSHASDVIKYSQQCLLRCLMISNQAISKGMTGWLEYGKSNELDRLADRPFVVLRQIAYSYGRLGQWEDAESVLLANAIRCEQHLPLSHPTTLTSLLDLAIAASRLGKLSFSERIVSRVAQRLSTYLSDAESVYTSHLSTTLPSGVKPGDTVFRIEHGRNACGLLREYVSLFRTQLGRDMVALVDNNDEIVLINHCFVADSLLVLANCLAAAKSLLGSGPDTVGEDDARYVKLAFAHYELAFNGLSSCKGLDDPNTIKSAYGLARCLREFGETKKALRLLSLVITLTERNITAPEPRVASPPKVTSDSERPTTRFLPFSFSKLNSNDRRAAKHTSSALCLWLMAVLSLDQATLEDGREQAFSYLHAASVSLQSALNAVSRTDDEATKTMCIRFLAMIEDEAMKISEPAYE